MPYVCSIKLNAKQRAGEDKRHAISAFYRKQQSYSTSATPCSIYGGWAVDRASGNTANACTHAVGGRRSKHHVAANVPGGVCLSICQHLR